MKDLVKRINKGVREILKAKDQGIDTSYWEKHLFKLLGQLEKTTKVKVKLGKFGICTCLVSRGLCTGCWMILGACICVEKEVNRDDGRAKEYLTLLEMINAPLKH